MAQSRAALIAWLGLFPAAAQESGGSGANRDRAARLAQVVEVVEGERRPVAGIAVWCLDSSWVDEAEWQAVEEQMLVVEAWLPRLGRRLVSDADGLVELPAQFGRNMVVATWTEGRFARHDVKGYEPARCVPLVLQEDRSLRVRVVDEQGEARAGVPVAAWARERRICGNCGPRNAAWWVAESDQQGLVEVPHAQWFFAANDEGGSLGDREHLVGLGFPTRAAIRVSAEPSVHSATPLELVAPPTGRLELAFEQSEGAPCLDPLRVVIAVTEKTGSMGIGTPFGERSAIEGRCSWSSVEIGIPLLVRAWSDRYGFVEAIVAGPTNPGETATATVRFGDDGPAVLRVTGRALDEQGEPLRRTTLIARPAGQGSAFDWALTPVRTDEHGRFELNLDRRLARKSPLLIARPWSGARWLESRSSIEATTLVEWYSRDSPRPIDVGDVRLQPVPVVIAGRLVDEQGAPLPAIEVRVANPSWGLDFYVTTTDDRGEFRLYEAEIESATLKVEPQSRRHRLLRLRRRGGAAIEDAEWGPVVPRGVEDVELVLQRLGSVRGRVAAAVALDMESVRITAQPEPIGGYLHLEQTDRRLAVDAYPDGTFEIFGPAELFRSGLEIGVRITRGSRGSSIWNELVDVRHVAIPPSGFRVDPRLLAVTPVR